MDIHNQETVLVRPRMLPSFAAAMLTITLFALTPITTRIAVGQINPLSLGMLRTVVPGLMIIPVLLVCRLRAPRTQGGWVLLSISALGAFVGFPLLFCLGTQNTSASHAALIMASMPLFSGIIAMIVEGHWPRLTWIAGSVLAFAGEGVLVANRVAASGNHQATGEGDMLVLAACLAWAIGVIAGSRLATRIGSWSATFWALAIAGIGLLPFASVRIDSIAWEQLAPATWISLLQMTLGATIVAYVAWFWALAHENMVRVSALQFAQPVLALIFAALLLHEQLTLPLLLAAIAILIGVLVACAGNDSVAAQEKGEPVAPCDVGQHESIAFIPPSSTGADK